MDLVIEFFVGFVWFFGGFDGALIYFFFSCAKKWVFGIYSAARSFLGLLELV